MKEHRILFLISRFLDGGIDTVLVSYLQHLSLYPNYKITLAIGTAMDELEVFRDIVPDNVEVVHLVKAQWLTRWRKQKVLKGEPVPIKLLDETILTPIRRHIVGQGVQKLAKMHDVIIDFDCCFYSFLQNVPTPKIAWFHFSFEQSLVQNRRRMQRIARRLDAYDKVVVISKAMRDEGIKLFPWLAEKTFVIYNAMDRETLLQKAEEPVDDECIGQPFLLAVERLEESQKDITTLLHAYKIFREEFHHEERLYLLGKGRSEEELRQLAEELGMQEHVRFLGFSKNPYPWMKRARALVHSAKLEGLPTVLVEGLMLDKLIVATDCPTGPREILDGGEAGMLVPVGDAQAMAEALHKVLTDPALQDRLLQAGQRHRQKFTFEVIQQQFEALIAPYPSVAES